MNCLHLRRKERRCMKQWPNLLSVNPRLGGSYTCPLALNPYPYQLDNGCGLVVDDYNFEDQIGMYYNIEPE